MKKVGKTELAIEIADRLREKDIQVAYVKVKANKKINKCKFVEIYAGDSMLTWSIQGSICKNLYLSYHFTAQAASLDYVKRIFRIVRKLVRRKEYVF